MNISNSIYDFDLIKKCTDIWDTIYITSLQTFYALIVLQNIKILAKHSNK